jgi:hypothetical protein
MTKKQINIRVEQDTKQRWDSALESPQYDSLTHLIVLAVEKELQDEDIQASGGAGDQTENILREEILPNLNQVENAVRNVESRVESVEQEVKRQGHEYELEKAILDVLPTRPEEDVHADEFAPTIEEVHATLESRGIIVDKPDIRRTLNDLVDDTGFVKRIEGHDDDPHQRDSHYWRKP